MPDKRQVAIIGWDCATPQLIFDRDLDGLPNLKRLVSGGVYGRLRSSDPPITVPAWTCMMTGVDAGTLGFYGFRNRKDYSYDGLTFATSLAVRRERVWERLGREGLHSLVIGVPQTFPPRPFNGRMVTCFLTPSVESQFTHPPELKGEIGRILGGEEYLIDVKDFRTDDKQYIIDQCYKMTEQRTRIATHLLAERPWDFFMMVEMGIDRLYHGLWSFTDPAHPKYKPGNPYENAIRDYHRFLDARLGEVLAAVGDDAVVFVVSDHGAKKMDGGICVNEWLIANGWLALEEPPAEPAPLAKCKVDWSRTRAWGEGGYYGRIFINVKGREPRGIVPHDEYESVRDELAAALAAVPDHTGKPIGTRVLKAEEMYRTVNGIPPDLTVYWGDLDWRSVGQVGTGCIHTFENDTGPDDANHDYHGIFVMYDPGRPGGGRRLEGLHLMDVAPTILGLYGLEPEPDVQGKRVQY
ncbi:MAG: phosphodiesterase [Planctomycetes bacterium DG_20]|nr:MAG: phosphodiesterase [Planctomycetes bacterium DG_20]